MLALHHAHEVIAADYELSERLGAEILAAGCEPLDAPLAPVKSYVRNLVQYWSARSGTIETTLVWVVEEV